MYVWLKSKIFRHWLCYCYIFNTTFSSSELGNTISSLFGGGSSSTDKENATDTVQVKIALKIKQFTIVGHIKEKSI